MERNSLPRTGTTDRLGALCAVITLMIASCWSGSALARTQTGVADGACDEIPSLEATVDSLSLDRIDHVAIETDLEASKPLQPAASGKVSALSAPLLDLTPRVADALREIFADAVEPGKARDAEKAPASPVAGATDVSDSVTVPTEGAARNEGSPPMLQRQMYRTDI